MSLNQEIPPEELYDGGTAVMKWARAGVSVLIAIAVLIALKWGIAFTKDKDAPETLLLRFYDAVGMETAASALRDAGLHPMAAKLILAMVAMTLGVLGIWALFWVANDLIGRVKNRFIKL